MPGWLPLKENHAIDVMAALFDFGQAMPDPALKKMLRSGEEAAFANGLKSRHATRGAVQISIGPQGIQTAAPSPAISGFVFNSIFENEEGALIPARVSEQLQLDANQIIYRAWNYVSWSWQFERLCKLLLPAFEVASNVVSVSKIRLEYLDKFWFDGDAKDADLSTLLREDSPYLAPHIFKARDLWHLHTGTFSPAPSGVDKRLKQIVIDAFDNPAPNAPSGPNKRWVHIVTAIEDRFALQPLDDDSSEGAVSFDRFNEMHSELKLLFAELITSQLAKRIFLLEGKQ